MSSNQTGSCTVVPGLSTVNFSLSSNMANIVAGDLFKISLDSAFYTIASVDGTSYRCTLSSRYSNSLYTIAIVNEQIDTGDGSKSYSGTLAHLPSIPGTTAFADGSNIESFSDNGAGILTGSLGGTGIVNYETGVVSLEFFKNVSIGSPIYATTYNYGIPLSSMPFLIVRDYTPNFNWPEPYSTDQNPETIVRQALRLIDNDLFNHASHTYSISIIDSDTSVTTGNGKKAFTIPYLSNGYNLTDVIASVNTKGITGTMNIQIRRRRGGSDSDMLQTLITVGDEYFARDGVVNTSYDDIATGDQIYVDIDTIHTTPAQGLSVTLTFQKS